MIDALRVGVLLFLAGVLAIAPGQAPTAPVLPAVDYRALVAKADLVYDTPVERSEEGIPLGNGRMGSLVWTTPTALKFQINRVDLQPINRDTDSFFERNTDYMGGCGFVDIELASAGPDVFPADGTTQHLSVYDALLDETEVRLVAPAARGRAVVLIASAATLDANEDVVASALGQLDAAVLKDFAGLASSRRTTTITSISWRQRHAGSSRRSSTACCGTPPATSARGARSTGSPT